MKAPKRLVVDSALYFTDNGRVVCGAHCGMSAAFTLHDISGQQIQRVTAADAASWLVVAGDLGPLACEECGRAYTEPSVPALAPVTPRAAFLASLPAALDLYNARDAQGSRAYGPGDAAERIRVEVPLAVKAGLIPAGTKFSIRRENYSSIYVEITAWSGAVFIDGYIAHLMDASTPWDHADIKRSQPYERRGWDPRFTDALNEALALVTEIADRHNYDRSRIEEDYFNVGYYLHVGASSVRNAAQQGIAMESSPDSRELARKAQIAAQLVGARCVKSVVGKMDTAGDWAMSNLIRVAIKTGCATVRCTKSEHGHTGHSCPETDVPRSWLGVAAEIVPVASPPKVVYDKRRGWVAHREAA